ncbi:MAG TPA: DUF1697 domain-containing protein [Candidatus Acidoferrales bacterium]|nr:DUF1697 domain-containing protein [Candidatus Acidoferrales bacterium]
MPVYIAMLRGINVLGHKTIKMESLRASFEALGFRNVKTYIASGNVIFQTAKNSSLNLSKKIGDRISRDFGFPVSIVLITSKDLQKVVQRNPFAQKKAIDASRLHVTFFAELPAKTAWKNLRVLPRKPDLFLAGSQEVYLYCPDGYGRTKLSNAAFERILSVVATTRNWKTVNKLSEMAHASVTPSGASRLKAPRQGR